MIADLERRIKEVDAAISKVLAGGQTIQTRNGKVQMADLEQLRAIKADLEQQLAAEQAAARGGSWATPMAYYGKG